MVQLTQGEIIKNVDAAIGHVKSHEEHDAKTNLKEIMNRKISITMEIK